MDLSGLKGIRAIQIFLRNEIFFDESHYLEFDFRKFYSDELQNVTQESLRQKIFLFNSKYMTNKSPNQTFQ